MRTVVIWLLLSALAVKAQESCDLNRPAHGSISAGEGQEDPCENGGGSSHDDSNDDPAPPQEDPRPNPNNDPRPNPKPNDDSKPKPKPGPGGDASCRDNHPQCSMMDMLCGDDTYTPMMAGVCAKTCNLCEAVKNGPESSARCKNMSYTCARKTLDCNSQMNKIMCPWSCKTCTN